MKFMKLTEAKFSYYKDLFASAATEIDSS